MVVYILTLDVVELQMKSKKKKVLGVVEGGHDFFNFFLKKEGGHL